MTRACLVATIEYGAYVPAPFWFEVLYSLNGLAARSALSQGQIALFLSDVSDLDMTVDTTVDVFAMIDLQRIGQRSSLSIYDAAYLELALRLNLPLATRDIGLARSAEKAGVKLFSS